ncbi:hypothetical protein [Phenylobacterium sp.]|uniref:hypothetical protein n=1 Tax=Phenylobacterium sp. TaxID=1871053 RepID=UPI0025D6B934|nr:hypothetical protein [Phenylobacterium sp.]
MPDPSADAPRSGMSPAAWGAISAIAVAAIGAVVTLTTNWWQRSPPKAEARPAAAVAAATDPEAAPAPGLADPARWAGAWSGAFDEDGQRRRIELSVTPGCAKGKACGTIRVPHVPCTGEITLADVRPEGAEFRVERFKPGSAAACEPGAGEVFRETPEGALAYTATYSGATGVLTRAD